MFEVELLEKENKLFNDLRKCKESVFPTFIFGAGMGGHLLKQQIPKEIIEFDGFIVDEKYLNENDNVMCWRDIFEKHQRINVIVAIMDFQSSMVEKYIERINILSVRDIFALNLACEPNILTYNYVKGNTQNIEWIYGKLEDDLSRDTLYAYLNQKISMNYGYMEKVCVAGSYFEESIVYLKQDEVFVDCGAYNGDSALEFASACYKNNLKYKNIISFEPDPINFAQLKENRLENHEVYNIALSDRVGTVHININDTISSITENGEEVKTDTIDNVLKGKAATYIKMDIEGAEKSALRGAAETIKKYRPRLAICIEHRNDDIWKIPEVIRSIRDDYRFYIRAHKRIASEIVLYAI